MTDKPKCETCKWYEEDSQKSAQGSCHVNPPVLYFERPSNRSFWPVVNANDWCRQHPNFFGT